MKETNKLQKLLMAACLAVLIFFAATVVLRFFTRTVLVSRLGMDNGFTRTVLFDNPDLRQLPGEEDRLYGDTDDWSYDWAAEYPFPPAKTASGSGKAVPRLLPGFVDRYTEIVEELKTRIDTYTQTNLVGYKAITGLSGKLEQAVGWNFASFNEYNGLYRLEDGWWTALTKPYDTSESAASLADFSAFLEEVGVELLYVQAPYKVCKEDGEVSGVLDYANRNADQLLELLNSSGIDTLDLRQELHEDALNHHEAFFRTDHHWTGETGLWAAGKVAAYLNENRDFRIDMAALDPANFRAETYPDYFLGSQGKKLTLSVAEPEDFSLLYPTYETELRFSIPSIDIDLRGDFSVTYNLDAMEGADLYSRDPYHAYSYGDRALIRYENALAREEKKVLLLHDSFSDVVQSFLALGLKNLESMDLRYFSGSLESYIRENKPDVVIVLYNPGEISGKIDWSSHRDLFDFR